MKPRLRDTLRELAGVPMPRFVGGNRVALLQGGDALFPRMLQAIAAARREVWLATYIFHDDPAARAVSEALIAAAARGVTVRVVVDGFGSIKSLPAVRTRLAGSAVQLEVFRPLDRWWAWLQPGQLRRLHQKLCAVDGRCAFVGGINVIDDRFDINHGWSDTPRLDFALRIEGPVAAEVSQAAQALWMRSHLGRGWREEIALLVRSAEPVARTARLLRGLRARPTQAVGEGAAAAVESHAGSDSKSPALPAVPPVHAALVVRDNFTQRRAIERAYVQAIGAATERIDIACSYFYPGRAFRRALRRAAARGVRIRLLMQGKSDDRLAGRAAR
ncbi:MAG: phospholipase D-like domain-containing protein, partial [Rubrivivax sp.]